MTSFYTVTFTLILLEWGSVHTNYASTNFTLLSPFMFLRQSARSSGDSSSQNTHGGLWYLLHSLQCWSTSDFVIPSVISIYDFKQLMQVFEEFGGIMTPHMQQRLYIRSTQNDWYIHLLGFQHGWIDFPIVVGNNTTSTNCRDTLCFNHLVFHLLVQVSVNLRLVKHIALFLFNNTFHCSGSIK